jgi:pentachlorophenol monooxygenase
VVRREAQLLIDYSASPIVTAGSAGGPTASAVDAGRRAPDAAGLTRDAVTDPFRLFALLGVVHTLLLYVGTDVDSEDIAHLERTAEAARAAAHGQLTAYLVAAPGVQVAATMLPLVRDDGTEFARAYAPEVDSVYVVRPDGYLGYVCDGPDIDALVTHLRATFASLR